MEKIHIALVLAVLLLGSCAAQKQQLHRGDKVVSKATGLWYTIDTAYMLSGKGNFGNPQLRYTGINNFGDTVRYLPPSDLRKRN